MINTQAEEEKGKKHGFWNLLSKSIRGKSTSQHQLEQAIPALENSLNMKKKYYATLINTKKQSSKQTSMNLADRTFFVDQALEFLTKARKALENREVAIAWANYYDAELLSFKTLDNEELQIHAKQVFNGSDTLADSNKTVVRTLLGKADDGKWTCKSNCTMEEVSGARKAVQSDNTEKYTQLNIARKPLTTLAIVSILLIGIIIYSMNITTTTFNAVNFSATGFNASAVNATEFSATNFNATDIAAKNVTIVTPTNNLWLLITVAAFGALGATASGLLTISKDSLTGDIPKRLLDKSVMLIKPVFGALAGMAIYVFLIGGLLQSLTGTAITNYLAFAICFVAGFSEKFFLGAIEKADQPTKE